MREFCIEAYMLGPGRPYATLIAHAAVHGMPGDVEVQGHASRRLVELAGSELARGRSIAAAGLDHRFVVACVISLVLGWIALDSWMPHAVGLEELDEAKVAAGLTAVGAENARRVAARSSRSSTQARVAGVDAG